MIQLRSGTQKSVFWEEEAAALLCIIVSYLILRSRGQETPTLSPPAFASAVLLTHGHTPLSLSAQYNGSLIAARDNKNETVDDLTLSA